LEGTPALKEARNLFCGSEEGGDGSEGGGEGRTESRGEGSTEHQRESGVRTYEQLREQRTARPKPEIMGPPGASQ
jgi:hypothetical protein